MSDSSRRKRFLKTQALGLVREGKVNDGIDKYREYLSFDDNNDDDDAWAGLGGAYRRRGDFADAIESYERAYQLNPESTYALVNVVSLLAGGPREKQEKLKDYLPKALERTHDKVRSDKADHWTWYDLATLQLINGELDAARSSMNYAAEITPKTAKENFRSVISSLRSLQDRNPDIEGISEVIAMLSERLSD